MLAKGLSSGSSLDTRVWKMGTVFVSWEASRGQACTDPDPIPLFTRCAPEVL